MSGMFIDYQFTSVIFLYVQQWGGFFVSSILYFRFSSPLNLWSHDVAVPFDSSGDARQ